MPEIDVRAAGLGIRNDDLEEIKEAWLFAALLIRHEFRAKPEDLRMITVDDIIGMRTQRSARPSILSSSVMGHGLDNFLSKHHARRPAHEDEHEYETDDRSYPGGAHLTGL